MRAFVGIKLDDCIQDVEVIINNLKQKDSSANFSKISNIHITLDFLGEIDSSDISKISDIFSNIDYKCFNLKLNSITNLRDNIILGIYENYELISLQASLNRQLLNKGFKLESRKYFPHVTLARRSILKLHEHINLKNEVKEIILFSSNKVNNELVYTPILRKSLGTTNSNF